MDQELAAMNEQRPQRRGHARPGDFDFLEGTWSIRNRRLKTRWVGSEDWELFEGQAVCQSVAGGTGSIEQLRFPPDRPRGLGIRLLDETRGLWSDHWVAHGQGVIVPAPMWGEFVEGVGTFLATDDRDGEIAIWSRGVWDSITPTSCRWHQAFSRDGGVTWEHNWFMQWTKVA
jgi:hypothetical protein